MTVKERQLTGGAPSSKYSALGPSAGVKISVSLLDIWNNILELNVYRFCVKIPGSFPKCSASDPFVPNGSL